MQLNLTSPDFVEDTQQVYQPSSAYQTFTEAQALEELQSKRFADVTRRYYSTQFSASTVMGKDPSEMTHDELLRTFYEDRVWANNNSLALGSDLAQVTSMSENETQDFAYISNLYSQLPSFWNDPNRDFDSWLYDYGGALLVDPINLIGFGVGGQTAKVAYKEAVKAGLKEVIKKKVTKDVLNEAIKTAQKQGIKKAVIIGGVKTGALNTVIAGSYDAILQKTNIEAGLQENFSLKRSAISSAFGFGLGTVFGSAFSGVGFYRTLSKVNNKSLKAFDTYSKNGVDINGNVLFKAVDSIVEGRPYQNIKPKSSDSNKGDDLVDEIRLANDDPILPTDKPPIKQINYNTAGGGNTKQSKTAREIIENDIAKELDDINSPEAREAIDRAADAMLVDPDQLWRVVDNLSKENKQTPVAIVAAARDIYKNLTQLIDLGDALNRIDLDEAGISKLMAEFDRVQNQVAQKFVKIKELRQIIAQSLKAMDIDGNRLSQGLDRNKMALDLQKLLTDPELPTSVLNKIEGSLDDKLKYMQSIGRLSEPKKVAEAIENMKGVDKWDVINSYVNNNLLSSPDTTFLNVLSGLANSQWKPFVMLVKSGNMMLNPKQQKYALETAEQAYKTWIYQWIYTADAIKAMGKSLYRSNPILDPRQTKFDSQVRQGVMERWLINQGETWIGKSNAFNRGVNRFVIKPVATSLGVPMRVVGASDEFLKVMMFKGRAGAMIDAQMRKTKPEIYNNRAAYKKEFKKMMDEYIDADGRARDNNLRNSSKKVGDSLAYKGGVDEALQYAREGTYTQALEGGIGGAILGFAERNKWARLLGLHFISTPTNLLRWNMQHFPVLGKYQFQMRKMLEEVEPPKGIFRNPFRKKVYKNPEAAAEALARMRAGGILWTAAFTVAWAKTSTGGHGKDSFRESAEKEKLGNKKYSMKWGDKRISFLRADPVMLPFGIAADIVDFIKAWDDSGKDMPKREYDAVEEISGAIQLMLVRNLTSKFYTKSIFDMAGMFLNGDAVYDNNLGKASASFFSQQVTKVLPLSGAVAYSKRVLDDESRELLTFADKVLNRLPLNYEMRGVMPKRNIFGEIVKREKGWFFGAEIPSSPFAMSNITDEASLLLRDMDLDYVPPSRTDSKTGINMDEIRNPETLQTAWDYWMEKSGTIKINNGLKEVTMKEAILSMLTNPQDPKYKLYHALPDYNVFNIRTMQKEAMIKDIVHLYQKTAFTIYIKEPANLGEVNPLDGTAAPNIFPQFKEKEETIIDTFIDEVQRMQF